MSTSLFLILLLAAAYHIASFFANAVNALKLYRLAWLNVGLAVIITIAERV